MPIFKFSIGELNRPISNEIPSDDNFSNNTIYKDTFEALVVLGYSKKDINNHIIERLLPGENDMEASTLIIDIVDRSSRRNWKKNLSDITHKISKYTPQKENHLSTKGYI